MPAYKFICNYWREKEHGPYQLEITDLTSLAIHLMLMILEKQNCFLRKRVSIPSNLGKSLEDETLHLCQRPLDQAGCKSRDVHEWQGPEGESQHANPQDRPPQYFSENLPHTGIKHALPEDFSPRHLRPYQLAYTPGG
ncbi:Uncharacterized protein Fot_35051 [Forsythia ovata]|uniref:Uncharacterized protein n=1 Tax=Forsythia ovata TaxID=205694 RepID=A0ABD1SN74_9LAMI